MGFPLEYISDRVGFCDPAGSKTRVKKVRARSAIVILGQDHLTRVFVLHVWAKRCTTDEMTEEIFRCYEEWQPRRFAVEANAMQLLYAHSLSREAKLRMQRLPIEPYYQPTGIEKPYRNRLILQPIVDNHRLCMLDSQTEARAELQVHPMGQTFDIIDCLAGAASLLPQRPQKSRVSAEAMRLAQQLRREGVAPWIIERKLKSLNDAMRSPLEDEK